MNDNIKKHELLEILSTEKINNKTPLGVGFDKILELLKIDKEYLDFICGELYGTGEIKYFDNGVDEKGLYATSLGVKSHSSKNYIERQNKKNWELAKNWVQTVVPILSLVIAIIVLTLSNRSYLKEVKSELKEVKERLIIQENKQHVRQEKTKNMENDSLTKK